MQLLFERVAGCLRITLQIYITIRDVIYVYNTDSAKLQVVHKTFRYVTCPPCYIYLSGLPGVYRLMHWFDVVVRGPSRLGVNK